MALAVEGNAKVHHLDVTTASLYGEADENLYMETPKMLNGALTEIIDQETTDSEIGDAARKILHEITKPEKVCHVQEAIHGLQDNSI